MKRKTLISLIGIAVCAGGAVLNPGRAFGTFPSGLPGEFAEKAAQVVEKTSSSSPVKAMTTDLFLEKVHDYKTNPDVWIYKGDMPCVIDFYADWCGPCRMQAPILEELAKAYDGRILVYKVNVDKEKELSTAFGIRSIPSLLFVPMSGKPAMQAGMMSKEQLTYYVRTFLLGEKPEEE